jgi:hypothetical protein
VADGDRWEGTGEAGSKQASSLRNTGFGWLLRGDWRSSATDRKGIRKPMLYPLSYEGRPAALPGPEPIVLALVRVWSASLAGPQCPRLAPGAVSHGRG